MTAGQIRRSLTRAGGSDLKAFDPLLEEVDRFLRYAESVRLVSRFAELLGCLPELFATCRETCQKRDCEGGRRENRFATALNQSGPDGGRRGPEDVCHVS